MNPPPRIHRWLGATWAKPLLMLACAAPAVWLWGAALAGYLGPNPAEALIRGLGLWTLRLLCLTLAVTPVRRLTGWTALLRFRRMLGLWTFAYAVLHLSAYAWLDMGLYLEDIARDVLERPFITVGMLAVLLMLPLAATSSNRAVRWLGPVRWRALHRAVYAVGVLAVLHFFWMRAGKNDFADVALYGGLMAALLLARLWFRRPGSSRI